MIKLREVFSIVIISLYRQTFTVSSTNNKFARENCADIMISRTSEKISFTLSIKTKD